MTVSLREKEAGSHFGAFPFQRNAVPADTPSALTRRCQGVA